MKIITRKWVSVSLLIISCFLFSLPPVFAENCTSAVVAGWVTADGRPLLWKNRDIEEKNNQVVFLTEGPLKAIAIVNAGSLTSVWMGVNEAGLAMINTASDDLEGSSSTENGSFQKKALLTCRTVDDFEALLRQTNSSGRKTKANYGVMDALGNGAFFETGNHTFTRFDFSSSPDTPAGILVRTNFAFTGDGTGTGQIRYRRACQLLNEAYASNQLKVEFILRHMARDLANEVINPYPLPYKEGQDGFPPGYIRTANSINRYRTRSAVVIQGVLPGEDPRLTTMWVMLGEPVCTVAVPVWVLAEKVPAVLNGTATAPFCDLALEKKDICYPIASAPEYLNTRELDDGAGGGIFSYSYPTEDWVINKAKESLASWRSSLPSYYLISQIQEEMANLAYNCFLSCSRPHPHLQAPRDFHCQVIENRSLLLKEYVHYLTWRAPAAGDPVAYRVYEIIKGKRKLVAEVKASAQSFCRRNIDPTKNYVYVVLGVDQNGEEGNPSCFQLPSFKQNVLGLDLAYPLGYLLRGS